MTDQPTLFNTPEYGSDGLPMDWVVRIAEIRQENRGGDVSATDIEWLCRVAYEALTLLQETTDGMP